jgi:enamine deaminase RidA (YjgF/YER057c/UK114 family)
MSQPSTGPVIGQPTAKYAPYRRVGDFIFLSGVIAVNPARQRVIEGYADLPADVRRLLGESGEMSNDVREGPVLAQSWFVLDSIRRIVESAGGQMSDVFKLVQYFRNLDHYPLYNRVRKLFFPAGAPVSTVVEVSAMLPTAAVLLEVEATAFVPVGR